MKKLITTLGLTMVLTVFAGCTLYFGPDDDRYYSYCDETGCWTCDNCTGECWSDGDVSCASDYDCASGFYCDQDVGSCVDSGFCNYDTDCAPGYSCDDRASCVPDPVTSCWDTGCPWGYYCDNWGGSCVPSTTCNFDADCGAGYTCQSGTCTPLGCTDDNQCATGSICELATGSCIVTNYCTDDNQCAAREVCDLTRLTCIPDPNPPTCEELTDEASCDADPTCIPIYTGVNCTDPAGSVCTSGSSNCTCESFVFGACVTAAL